MMMKELRRIVATTLIAMSQVIFGLMLLLLLHGCIVLPDG